MRKWVVGVFALLALIVAFTSAESRPPVYMVGKYVAENVCECGYQIGECVCVIKL